QQTAFLCGESLLPPRRSLERVGNGLPHHPLVRFASNSRVFVCPSISRSRFPLKTSPLMAPLYFRTNLFPLNSRFTVKEISPSLYLASSILVSMSATFTVPVSLSPSRLSLISTSIDSPL